MISHFGYTSFQVPQAGGGGGLPAILTTGLQQWFAPEVATSTSEFIVDQSGNTRNGTISGAQWSWNASNYAEIVSGTSTSNVIQCGYHVDLSTSFTVQIWASIVDMNAGGSEAGLMHMIPNTGDSTNTLNFRFDRAADRLKYQLRSTTTAIINNVQYTGDETNWTMYTITYDGTTAYAYANETLVTSGTGVMTSGKANFYIAGIFDNNANNYFTNVSIGSVKQYSAYHSSTDISTNFNAEKAHYGL